MRNVWKKVCACVLCATMMVGVKVPSTSKQDMINVTAEDDHDGEFTYQKKTYQYKNIDSSKISIVRIKEQGGEVTVPSTVTIGGKKKTVTRIDGPFADYQTYTAISLPSTVTEVSYSAFAFCVINKLKLSDNLEKIGEWVFWGADIKQISCSSKKLKEVGGYIFWDAKSPDIAVLGDWLVRYNVPSNVKTIDLTSSKLSGVTKAVNYVFNFDEHVTDLKIGNNNALLKTNYYWNGCQHNIKNVYLNGKLVKCTGANETVPKIIKDNYDFFDWGYFNAEYTKQKAKYVLESLGLTYYGPNYKYLGSLSPKVEYNVCKKVHDYIVKNYTYDTSANGSFGKVFNCHTVTKCAFDAMMYAYLVECAGVDAETVDSQELIPISAKEKEELLKKDPSKVTPDGKYKYGKWGNHRWNVVKIGGKLYYIDTTNDRTNHMYCLFLFSNDTTDYGTDMWGGGHIDEFPIYSNYSNDKWNKLTITFQNRSNALKKPNCSKIHGDINKDYYCRGGDEEMLGAFLCVGSTIRNKCLQSKDGYVSLTDSEFKTINSSTSGNKTITLAKKENGKIKLLFDPSACDVNFDGAVDICDLVCIAQRLGDPLKK